MRTISLMQGLLILLLAGCVDTTPPTDELQTQTAKLVHDRSLAITDPILLAPFSLERVLTHLVTTAGLPSSAALQLFRQMWNTQNSRSGATDVGPYCDDFQNPPGMNGFPWSCDRLEGDQAGINPFQTLVARPGDKNPLYIPIGIFNRFDLAPINGAHCGEYRIVYAMRPGHQYALGNGRNFMIFEAVLPNPDPEAGLAGCEPIARMWADFSDQSDAEVLSTLDEFFFGDSLGFGPVVHPHNYGLMIDENSVCSSGQIRTNQFNQDPWILREYKLAVDCRCGPCDLRMIPLTVKTNPAPEIFFFDPPPPPLPQPQPHPLAPMLETTLTSQVSSLSATDVNTISYQVDDRLNAAESVVLGFTDNYVNVASTNTPLHNAITAALPTGSPLTSDDILERALTQSCAGCHELSNGKNLGGGLIWPPSLGFVHVGETVGPDGKYPISQALENEFLPFREQILIDYLADPSRFGGGVPNHCAFALPPELEPAILCSADQMGRKNLVEALVSSTDLLRELRMAWEGDAILGRRSGH